MELEIEGGLESIKKGSEYCSRCFVLEERCKKVEEWSIGLESDLEAKRHDIVVLHAQMDDVLKSFPKGSDEKSRDEVEGDNKGGGDSMEEVENDKVSRLMIVDSEKNKAEIDVEFWKAKCVELESRVRVLENQLSSSTSGTANVVVNQVFKTEAVKDDISTPLIHTLNEEISLRHSSRARKQLNFSEETRDEMAPPTPAAGLINNRDTLIVKDESEVEVDITHCYQGTPTFPTKRKRASSCEIDPKWESRAHMSAAFLKDPELCMMAVCALYRQQMPDEKLCRRTIHRNYRGFSQDDAMRGSILGEFLTDGDPEGCLNKSVEELKKFLPEGLEVCRELARYYSQQLFTVYENEVDLLWP